jgi:hypothetical protein
MEGAKEKSQTIHELALEGDFEVTSNVNVRRTINFFLTLTHSVAVPGSRIGAFLAPGSQTDISESLVTIF